MSDYAGKIKDLRSTLQNTQLETTLLLRPYDVTRVQSPITEDVTDWSAAQYTQTVKEHASSTPKRQKHSWLPFLGRIAKTVFGVATEDDVTSLHYHIAKFEKTKVETDTTHVLETVHSLYQAQDKRMTLLYKMMQGFNYNLTFWKVIYIKNCFLFFQWVNYNMRLC
jgi:hypothetical protein